MTTESLPRELPPLPTFLRESLHDYEQREVFAYTRAAIESALAAAPQGVPPEGWVMVPREPTPEMVRAVDDDAEDKYLARGRAVSAWKSMIAAAPALPVPLKPEPVAWRRMDEFGWCYYDAEEGPRTPGYELTPLYASPVPVVPEGLHAAKLEKALLSARALLERCAPHLKDVDRECCGGGVQNHPEEPPECCNQPIDLSDLIANELRCIDASVVSAHLAEKTSVHLAGDEASAVKRTTDEGSQAA